MRIERTRARLQGGVLIQLNYYGVNGASLGNRNRIAAVPGQCSTVELMRRGGYREFRDPDPSLFKRVLCRLSYVAMKSPPLPLAGTGATAETGRIELHAFRHALLSR